MMPNDELICAYLDGELDADKRAEVERWIGSDRGASARVERVRRADALIRRALPSVCTPKDDPLAAMIMAPVVSNAHQRNWARQAAALAAACVLGVLGGRLLTQAGAENGAPLLSISHEVAGLLDALPSGQSAVLGDGRMEMILSLRTERGDVCRQYRLDAVAGAADVLACRRENGWQAVALVAAPPRNTASYVVAGGTAPIDAAITQLGGAWALNEQEEQSLIRRGWRTR